MTRLSVYKLTELLNATDDQEATPLFRQVLFGESSNVFFIDDDTVAVVNGSELFGNNYDNPGEGYAPSCVACSKFVGEIKAHELLTSVESATSLNANGTEPTFDTIANSVLLYVDSYRFPDLSRLVRYDHSIHDWRNSNGVTANNHGYYF